MKPVPAMIGPDHAIDLAAPNFSAVPWRVLIESLCVVPRFNGAFGPEPTVAGHSLHVHDMAARDLKLAALIHDFHEAAMGDVIRPTRRRVHAILHEGFLECDPDVPYGAIGSPLDRLEDDLQAALFAKAGLPWPLDADAMERLTEWDDAVCAHELSLGRARGICTLPRDYRRPCADQVEGALRRLLEKAGVPYGPEV